MLHLNASFCEKELRKITKHAVDTLSPTEQWAHNDTNTSKRYRGIQQSKKMKKKKNSNAIFCRFDYYLTLYCRQRATVAANYACESYNGTMHLQRFLLCFVFIFIISGASSSTTTTIIIMLALIAISAIYIHAPVIVCCSVQSLFCISAAVDVLLHI